MAALSVCRFDTADGAQQAADSLPSPTRKKAASRHVTVVWMDLVKCDLGKGAPVMILDPHDPE